MKERFIKKPNLPDSNVSCLIISDRVPDMVSELKKNNIRVILSEGLASVEGSEKYHADMSFCHTGDNKLYYSKNISAQMKSKLKGEGIMLASTEHPVSAKYPYLNICIVGENVICSKKTADKMLIRYLKEKNYNILHTNQGYSRCSSAVISENAIITADDSIYEICIKNKIDALKISPGHILLDGYPYGFIGGCCTLISKDILAFCGNIKNHPDYYNIKSFAENYGKSLLSMSDNELYDIGGAVLLKEFSE